MFSALACHAGATIEVMFKDDVCMYACWQDYVKPMCIFSSKFTKGLLREWHKKELNFDGDFFAW